MQHIGINYIVHHGFWYSIVAFFLVVSTYRQNTLPCHVSRLGTPPNNPLIYLPTLPTYSCTSREPKKGLPPCGSSRARRQVAVAVKWRRIARAQLPTCQIKPIRALYVLPQGPNNFPIGFIHDIYYRVSASGMSPGHETSMRKLNEKPPTGSSLHLAQATPSTATLSASRPFQRLFTIDYNKTSIWDSSYFLFRSCCSVKLNRPKSN